MSALQQLQEKITQWKDDHEALKNENASLKSQLAGATGIAEEKEAQCQSYEETIVTLRRELSEKDEEIEKIIAQVEALLA